MIYPTVAPPDTIRPLASTMKPGIFILLLLLVVSTGCSSGGPNQYPVSGTIRIGDTPVTGGFVVIEPADGSNSEGLQGYAPIRNGQFDTEQGGKRAVSGLVTLRINGWGAPSAVFKSGVPLCNQYELIIQLDAASNKLDLVIPESALIKEPPGGWGQLP